jgi:hypothetical protein
MTDKLPPYFIDLVLDATLKSFWTRRALQQFLRRCHVSDQFLATWSSEETKRDFLYRLFPLLEKADKGTSIIKLMATSLSEQQTFPDLERWEDAADKKKAAALAIDALRAHLQKQQEEVVSLREQSEARKRVQAIRLENIRRQNDLSKLSERLNDLSRNIGSSGAGYAFQDWFYDLMDFYEILSRRPYVTEGRQIDGSVTVEGTTYLVELKFTAQQAGAPDIDTFFKKVHGKADNTMGLMISMSGYSSVAIQEASGPKSPLLLLDYNHIYVMLSGTFSFVDIVNRIRRHASQTSQAYLRPADFGG